MEACTRATYTYHLRRPILPVFASMRIDEIRPADVREWVTDPKAAGASPTVIRRSGWIATRSARCWSPPDSAPLLSMR
jgi:hypothetical protein